MTSVLEVAEGGVTFLFYLPGTTSTTAAPTSTSSQASVSSRRSSSATFHKAAASQSTDLAWTSATTAVITSDGIVTTIVTTPSAYAPAVAFSTYAYTDPSQNATAATEPEPKPTPPALIAAVSVFSSLTVIAVIFIAAWLYRRRQRRRATALPSNADCSGGASRSRSTRGLRAVTPYHTDSDTDGLSPTTGSGVSLLRSGSSARPMLDVSDTVTFGSQRSSSQRNGSSAGSTMLSQQSPLSATRPPVSQTTGTILDRVDEDSYATFGDVAQAAPIDFNAAPPYTLEAGARQPALLALRPGQHPEAVLMPPPPAYVDPSDASIRRMRPASTRSLTTRYSLATEDDDDALAQDGSSLARTLTTESSGTIMSYSTRRRSDTSGRYHGGHEERRGSARSYGGSEADETSTATWTDDDSYANDTDSDVVVAGPGLIRRPTTTATYYSHSVQSPNGATFLSPFSDTAGSSATSASIPARATHRQLISGSDRDDPFADPAKGAESPLSALQAPAAPWHSGASRSSDARSYVSGDDRGEALPVGRHWQ